MLDPTPNTVYLPRTYLLTYLLTSLQMASAAYFLTYLLDLLTYLPTYILTSLQMASAGAELT